jgi:UDP-3-O-[3-hydroxymyristoyl] glucosamine N-acyltransferase
MAVALALLAAHVEGTIRGDASQTITGGAALEAAQEGDLSFVQDARQLGRLKDCRASAVVTTRELAEDPRLQRFTCLLVTDPAAAFMTLLQILQPPRSRPQRGIAPTACISPTAQIGPDCYIGPGVVIGDGAVIGRGCDLHAHVVVGPGCQIGDDVILHPHVVLYPDVVIQDRVIIHAHAVVGADGFGYRFVAGRFEKIPQLGTVRIESDVEIGAGTTIDRGAIGATVIGEGTKLDNQVMIAHNCEIGRHNVFAAQVGLAGSCTTGDYVRLGGQVGVKDHIHLHAGCCVGAKGGVHKDIPPGETWIGYPATPEAEQKRLVFAIHKLPQLREQVRQLTAEVAALQAELSRLREGHTRAA